jgi:uncharacterized protein (TIGR00251 family)
LIEYYPRLGFLLVQKIETGVILRLRVISNSACFRLTGFDAAQNELRVKVCSPAHKGKANKELLKGLKKIFNSNVEIIKGNKSNKKTVLVHASREQVLATLAPKKEKP